MWVLFFLPLLTPQCDSTHPIFSAEDCTGTFTVFLCVQILIFLVNMYMDWRIRSMD